MLIIYNSTGGTQKIFMKIRNTTIYHKIAQTISSILKDIYNIRIALILLLAYFAVTQSIFHTVCPFAILTGFSCPACGLTRAAFLLLTGHFTAAAQLNLTIYLWFPFLLYLCIFRYFLRKQAPLALPIATTIGLLTSLYFILRYLYGTPLPVPCEGIFPLKSLVQNTLQCYNKLVW